MLVQGFHKTAHVRSLEFFRQVHGQGDRRHGGLNPVELVLYLDGEAQAFDAYAVNGDVAGVRLRLGIFQFLHTGKGWWLEMKREFARYWTNSRL